MKHFSPNECTWTLFSRFKELNITSVRKCESFQFEIIKTNKTKRESYNFTAQALTRTSIRDCDSYGCYSCVAVFVWRYTVTNVLTMYICIQIAVEVWRSYLNLETCNFHKYIHSTGKISAMTKIRKEIIWEKFQFYFQMTKLCNAIFIVFSERKKDLLLHSAYLVGSKFSMK